MARIRYLKPEFFDDEDLAEIEHWQRLLYAGLWTIADKAGRLPDRPRWIQAKIFPYEPEIDIEDGLQVLSNGKQHGNKPFIQHYEIENIKYIQILTWNTHQKPHHTEKDSIIPGPPDLVFPLNNPLLNIKKKIKIKRRVHSVNSRLDNGALTVKGNKVFKIPSLEEIKLYCEEIKSDVNPEQFFHFYESKGWKIGKNSMKSWRSAVHTWQCKSKPTIKGDPEWLK